MFDTNAMNIRQAKLAYDWQTAFGSNKKYPTMPVGNAVAVSKALLGKYASYFASCA